MTKRQAAAHRAAALAPHKEAAGRAGAQVRVGSRELRAKSVRVANSAQAANSVLPARGAAVRAAPVALWERRAWVEPRAVVARQPALADLGE